LDQKYVNSSEAVTNLWRSVAKDGGFPDVERLSTALIYSVLRVEQVGVMNWSEHLERLFEQPRILTRRDLYRLAKPLGEAFAFLGGREESADGFAS
jgi:hypothetical protein